MAGIPTVEQFEKRLQKYRKVVVLGIPQCYADERLAYEGVVNPYTALIAHTAELEAEVTEHEEHLRAAMLGIGGADEAPCSCCLPLQVEIIRQGARIAELEAWNANATRLLRSGSKIVEDDGRIIAQLEAELVEKDKRIAELEGEIAAVPDLLEALRRAEILAGIASNWDLGDDGKVEIDGEWVACWALAKEFRAAIAKAHGEDV